MPSSQLGTGWNIACMKFMQFRIVCRWLSTASSDVHSRIFSLGSFIHTLTLVPPACQSFRLVWAACRCDGVATFRIALSLVQSSCKASYVIRAMHQHVEFLPCKFL